MKRLAISRTIIPLEYDKSTEGFNAWSVSIRNELHVSSNTFTLSTILPEVNKVLKFHTPKNK